MKLIRPIAVIHEEIPKIYRNFGIQLSIDVNDNMRTCVMYNQKFKNVTDLSEIISCQVKLSNDSDYYLNGSGIFSQYDDDFWRFSMETNIAEILKCNCIYQDCDFNYTFIKGK